MKRVRVLWSAVVVSASVWMIGAAAAQTTESAVKARLLDKPLYLRGMWAEDKLEFDGDGQPIRGYRVDSFTTAGMDVTEVQLRGDELRLKGVRMATMFQDHPEGVREPMWTGGPGGSKGKPEAIQVSVKGMRGGDFGKALDAIFADGLGDLTPGLPAIWQRYAQQHFVAGAVHAGRRGIVLPRNERTETGEVVVQGTQRGDPPPRLIHQEEPQFSEAARRNKVGGAVMVHFWVGPDGTPTHIEVAEPLGLGLDEKAVESVERYEFTPPVRNGNTVTLGMYVSVNFQIF